MKHNFAVIVNNIEDKYVRIFKTYEEAYEFVVRDSETEKKEQESLGREVELTDFFEKRDYLKMRITSPYEEDYQYSWSIVDIR